MKATSRSVFACLAGAVVVAACRPASTVTGSAPPTPAWEPAAGRPALEQSEPPVRVDFSGIDRFWTVADDLRRDQDPARTVWDTLFSTPGYAALDARERRRPALTAGIRAALMPSRMPEGDSLIKARSWAGRVAAHVRELARHRSDLETFRSELDGGQWLRDAVRQAQRYMPDGVTDRLAPPPVAFVFFLPDGRGYPELIVADLAHLRTKGDLVSFFAHEVTHFYHAGVARERAAREGSVAPEWTPLMELLTKVEEESYGDMHDKVGLVAANDSVFRARVDPALLDYMTEYRAHYTRAADLVALLDHGLVQLARNPADVGRVSDELAAALPLEGRPLGLFLLSTIGRCRGDQEIRSGFADPIGYLLHYQAAAIACRAPRFSVEGVELLKRIKDSRR